MFEEIDGERLAASALAKAMNLSPDAAEDVNRCIAEIRCRSKIGLAAEDYLAHKQWYPVRALNEASMERECMRAAVGEAWRVYILKAGHMK